MARIDYPEEVQGLVGELKRLPGIGPRSAERIAIWLDKTINQQTSD